MALSNGQLAFDGLAFFERLRFMSLLRLRALLRLLLDGWRREGIIYVCPGFPVDEESKQ